MPVSPKCKLWHSNEAAEGALVEANKSPGRECKGCQPGPAPSLGAVEIVRADTQRARYRHVGTGRVNSSCMGPTLRPCLDYQERCCAKCLFISNMLTLSLPSNTARSLSSARISRFFAGFCRLLALMYSHTLLTTSVRGKGDEPPTAASSFEGRSGFA